MSVLNIDCALLVIQQSAEEIAAHQATISAAKSRILSEVQTLCTPDLRHAAGVVVKISKLEGFECSMLERHAATANHEQLKMLVVSATRHWN